LIQLLEVFIWSLVVDVGLILYATVALLQEGIQLLHDVFCSQDTLCHILHAFENE